jgi:hypothetical protein
MAIVAHLGDPERQHGFPARHLAEGMRPETTDLVQLRASHPPSSCSIAAPTITVDIDDFREPL